MRMFLAALLTLLLPMVAQAQQFKLTPPVSDTNPQPQKLMCWNAAAAAYAPCAATASMAIDRGTLVATAGTAQQLLPANSARRGFAVQNQSAGSCYINGQGTATQDQHSLLIAAGTYYETPSSYSAGGAVSIVCTAANAPVYAREW